MKTTRLIWPLLLLMTAFSLSPVAGWSQLRANFSANIRSGCPPLVVAFKDSSSGGATSWRWDLGNGVTSLLQNPIATYFDPGTYNVKLVIQNASGRDSIVKSQFVTVNALPLPAFSVSDTMGCFPLKVRFDDGSLPGSGLISAYQWDFGDGTLSSDANPIHTYTSAGNFSVTLKITNTNGCTRVITKSNLIKIQNGVTAAFTTASSQGCQTSAPVMFINQSTGTGTLQYSWGFGNGTSSQLQNPVVTYNNSGSYTVRLIVSNSFGCRDTLIRPGAINIGVVKANFSKPDTVCTGVPVKFTNTSTPSTFVASAWNFGDGGTSADKDPTYTFSTSGVKTIKLVTDFGACRDSVTKTLFALPKPTLSFTANNRFSCKSPLTVNFNNTSSNAVSYSWDFGDGGTSTQKSPSYTYTRTGTFDVRLVQVNANGCTDTLVQSAFVRVAPPDIISLDSLMIKQCAPYTVRPHATIETGMPITSYLWQFGDGGTSTDSTPVYNYTTPGVYNVKLTVSSGPGCSDTLTLLQAVSVGVKPTVNFSATPLNVCANSPVNFTDLSTVAAGSTVDFWYWEFGDGGQSPEKNPMHQYNDTGWFNVRLTVASQGCPDTFRIDNYVYIRPPIARFDTAYNCSTRLTRQFKDSSIGATSWSWNFGDGGTSTLRNPTHTYASSGTYTVALTVSDGLCTHTDTEDILVLKQSPKLIISDSISCRATRMLFDIGNVLPGTVQRYRWFFDGITRPATPTNNAPVSQTYVAQGTRTPAVAVTDILFCMDTVFAQFPVKVYGPKASFTGTPFGGCNGTTISFDDSVVTDGIHPISTWTWYFGEGAPQTFTTGPFSYTYNNPGIFNVSMVVRDTYGCKDSVSKTSFITISQINADFSMSDTSVCPGTLVAFSNNSIGADVKYKWRFGDGDTSTVAMPTHTYANPGTYTVSLVVSDKVGCRDSIAKIISVYQAKAKFNISDSFATCPPLVVNTSNLSKNYIDYTWDFGDSSFSTLFNPSHIYTYPGHYTISLIVRNTGGCADTMRRSIVINGPKGSFGYIPTQVCNPGMVRYSIISQDAVNYIWDFSDGNTVYTTADTVSHVYLTPGTYVPKVILQDGGGCKVAITGADTVKVIGVETHILTSTRLLCDSGYITFTDSTITNDVVNGYVWDFGDGNTATSPSVTHGYAATGLYTVTLTATTPFGCSDTSRIIDCIKIAGSPKVRITGDSAGCEPAQLNFAGSLVNPDTSTITWQWIFDNGSTYTGQIPPAQAFGTAGSYNVKLMATTSDGCSDTTRTIATVHPRPLVQAASDTTICRGQAATLRASGATSFTWSSSPYLSCSQCAITLASPPARTTFIVTGSNGAGCAGSDSVTVDVRQPFVMTVGAGDTICFGQSVPLTASGADTYQWSPARWLSNAAVSNPVARPDTTVTFTVVGQDSARCFSDSGKVTVKVYPIPTIDITNGSNINLMIGNSVKLTTRASSDVVRYIWAPAQALSCATCAEPTTNTREDITYSVTAYNQGDCFANDKITIAMICENANVFIPNTFSPNGDGMNDAFFPRGAGLSNVRSMRVFNRWGQMVFQKLNFPANDASQGWDGKFNGMEMQSDVYVYVIEVICANNQVIPFKGNITLAR